MKRILILILTLLLIISILPGCSQKSIHQPSSDSKGVKKKIAVVLKALDSEHWLTVKKGAEKAAEEEVIDLAVLAPEKESDVQQQFKIIEDMIIQKVDALIIAPCDSKGVRPLMEMADSTNIPVFTVDTNADAKIAEANIVSFVGTDNKKGGKLAGERIIKILNGRGKVAIIIGTPEQQTHLDRKAGFKEAIETAPGIQLVAERSTNNEFISAMSMTENIIKSNMDIDAIFCISTPMAMGAMEAVNVQGKAGKIRIIGFDTQTDNLNAIKNGQIDSTVAQNPFNMGYISIKNAVRFLKGEQIPKFVDTETDLITIDNLDEYIK